MKETIITVLVALVIVVGVGWIVQAHQKPTLPDPIITIEQLQQKLVNRGYLDPNDVDGIYGKKTSTAHILAINQDYCDVSLRRMSKGGE